MADQVFAVNSGFYDAVNSDRTYSADDMNRPYKRVVSNGVFATPQGTKSTDLQVVSANNGMQIIVKKGEGIFADKWFENPAAINITVPANTSTVPRIDSVIVQVDKRTSGRVGNIVYRTGTPSVNPVAPSINTVSNVIEYRLANVRVETGTTAITTAMITDRRGSSDCPWVTSLIYQVDTSVLYDQWAAAYEEYFEAEKEMWDDWYSHLTEDLDVSMSLVPYKNTVVTTSETSEVYIGIPEFNANTDLLEVYINGMRAIEGSQYTVNGNTSIILSAPLSVGQTVNFVLLKSVIMGNPDDIASLIEALEQRIASIQGGNPIVVDSASEMTDTDMIYILSTDSKWYYYSLTSSAWVAGGVYGGVPTDTTLTQAGMAADAEIVGEKIDAINTNHENDLTYIQNNDLAFSQGSNQIYFRQGTAHTNDLGYIVGGGSSVRCRMPLDVVLTLAKNDTISIADGYELLPSIVMIDTNGVKQLESGSWTTSEYIAPQTGTYFLVVQKADQSVISPAEATSAITIYHNFSIDDLSSKVNDASDKLGHLIDNGTALEYTKTISGTRYITVNLALDAGTYRLTADSFVSSDTDASECRILFDEISGDDLSFYVARDVQVETMFELRSGCTRFFVYASSSSQASAGDTITVNNLTIEKELTNALIEELQENVASIQTKLEEVNGYHDLIKNPYQMDFAGFVEVISTTHAHAATNEQLATLASHYDHVAISNYYPSAPWYPMSDYYTEIPSGFMCSPNAEQARFSDWAAGVHACSVGSFLSRDTASYGGTIYDMIKQTISTLQYPNAGGVTINHPTYSSLTGAAIETILKQSSGVFAIEIYNGNVEAENPGNGYSISQWDYLLSKGIQIFGTAVPDHEAQYHPNENRSGFGYCHVLVRAKTEQQILLAYGEGRFYCSIYNDGLKFTNIKYLPTTGLVASINEEATIRLITARGTVYEQVGSEVTYLPIAEDIYVRIEVERGNNTLYSNPIMIS